MGREEWVRGVGGEIMHTHGSILQKRLIIHERPAASPRQDPGWKRLGLVDERFDWAIIMKRRVPAHAAQHLACMNHADREMEQEEEGGERDDD